MDNLRFLLVGTYSSLNKGDRLMQEVAIEQLRLRFPGCSITLLSPFVGIDKEVYRDISVEKSNRRNILLSSLCAFLLLLFPKSIQKYIITLFPELMRYAWADLVIDLSGDMLTEDYGIHIAVSHSFTLLFARLLKKKYCVVAQSVGKFKVTRKYFAWLLNSAEFVSSREGITTKYLLDIGVQNVVETADLGFLLKPERDSANQFVVKRPAIGFAPSALLLKKFGTANSAVDLQSQVKNLLAHLVSKGYFVVFVPHVSVPKGDGDFELACSLADLIPSDSTVLGRDLSPSQIKHRIQDLDLMIAFRMHAAIAALDSLVPTLIVSYSHKAQGLYEKLEIEDYVIPYDQDFYENMVGGVDMLERDRNVFSSVLKKNIDKVRSEARRNIDLIQAAVG